MAFNSATPTVQRSLFSKPLSSESDWEPGNKTSREHGILATLKLPGKVIPQQPNEVTGRKYTDYYNL